MNETEINGRILALQQQRDSALNQVVTLCGVLALRDKEIAELKLKEKSGGITEREI